ncbi:MAG: sugar ABC transporter permease [Clostridiales Family XIII bacterium]|jgi:putative multiple sugar transport system permease protein|nr:sugar ABC transporter permease [Clostridiales Family XIII bacterium]
MGMTKDLLKKNTMLIALIAAMVLFQVLILLNNKGSLFAPTNITNLISQNSYVVILATGMLLCILTGGNIDLSVGSGVALVSAVAGLLAVNMKVNSYLVILICLVLGVAMGAAQAYWIAYMRIPPFIVTLAGMLTFRGVAWLILQGKTISPFPADFTRLFNSYLPGGSAKAITPTVSVIVAVAICAIMILLEVFSRAQKKRKGYETDKVAFVAVRVVLVCAAVLFVFYLLGQDKGIPVVLILLAAVVLAYRYYTENTVPGRHLYAMGGNEKATRLSGINTDHTLFFAYTNMGLLVAVAALVCVSRFNSAAPSAGNNYELDAIGACFIGGASAYGGVGTVGGAAIGAVFMGVLNNGMSILGIDQNWQRTVKGLVLLAAVVFDVVSKKRKQSA